MKLYLFGIMLIFLTSIQTAVSSNSNFDYNLEIKSNVMLVTLDYTPVNRDSTTFMYGYEFYGGMKDLLKSVVNLQSNAKFKIDMSNSRITFYHPANTPIRITYNIIDSHKPEQKVVGEMFRPIITDNYFFSLSHTVFLNPDIDDKLKDSLMMSVTLNGNQAFPIYVSFAPEMTPGETVSLKLSDAMDALITGATDLHIEKRELAGIVNYVVLRINKNNSYNLNRFMKYFDTYLPAMTEFWGNLNGTYYSLIASKFLNIDYHNISGTAFNGGFHVKFSGDTILANDECIYTISHEIMHRYIGTGCVSLGENNQWFNEGFTDYTTWYLLSQCGIMPPEKLQETVLNTYKQLSANPFKNTPNEEVMKHFWDNPYYEKLPYNRGALFAAYINNRIIKLSNGNKSYRDLMRSLKATAEKKKNSLTIDDFIDVTSEFMPKDEIEKAFRQYIVNGEMIPEQMIFESNSNK